VLLLIGVTGLASLGHDVSPPARITPANAIHSTDIGPILNDYDFGGYLAFVGLAPFIHGRGELYGGAYMLRHNQRAESGKPSGLPAAARRIPHRRGFAHAVNSRCRSA
jgi:hypothetical protein